MVFEPGQQFVEDEVLWQVVKVTDHVPTAEGRFFRAARRCVFYFDVSEYNEPPPIEVCEYTPVDEMEKYLKAEREAPPLSSRFHATLSERIDKFLVHPVMMEPQDQAERGLGAELNDAQRAAVTAAYALRDGRLRDPAMRGPALVVAADVTVLIGMLAAMMEKQLRREAPAHRKRKPGEKDHIKEAAVTVLPKQMVLLKLMLVMAGFHEGDNGVYTAARPDAVRRLLGAETNAACMNPLVVTKFFKRCEIERLGGDTGIVDPFTATNAAIYTQGVEELGADARDARGEDRVFPEYMLRHKLAERRIQNNDTRLNTWAYVKEDVCFQIELKPVGIKPRQPCKRSVDAGARLSVSFAYQRMTRKTPKHTTPMSEFKGI